jgi:hypothetical protein
VARAIDMTTDDAHHRDDDDVASSVSRRSLIQSVPLVASGIFALSSRPVLAADSKPARSLESLESYLYTILRVKEATIQETRLITSGKFKDAARGNVKLAVKFMLNNYRLSDAVIAASAYIDDNNRRLAASDAGQAAVQNLYTILEYFDSQDVANIKVRKYIWNGNYVIPCVAVLLQVLLTQSVKCRSSLQVGQDSMASKEPLVLKGLDSTRKNIDDFLAYFPKSSVDQAREKLLTENELNKKEWDPALGDIFNLPSTSV